MLRARPFSRGFKSTSSRRVFRFAGGAAAVAGTGMALVVYQDEGVRRTAIFWSQVGPAYLDYRICQWRMESKSQAEKDEAYGKLHRKWAPKIEQLVLKMRGFYLKTAQLLSTIDYFLPPEYLCFCKRMQSEVPTEFAPGEVQRMIEKSLGKPLEEIFSSFDEVPVGSASIGQVHKAVLRETGQVVAVKVQGVGVEPRFRNDIKTLISFCRLAMPHHLGALREIQQQYETEFDYRGEAQNMVDVRNNIMPVFGDRVVIPSPMLNLCTKEVLVQEYLEGPSLVKGIKSNYEEFAKSVGKSLEELEKDEVKKLKEENKRGLRDLKVQIRRTKWHQRLLRFKESVVNFPRYLWNIHCWWFPKLQMNYVRYPQLLNLGEIIQLLNDVHAHEILINGCFNGDPHPGNVLLLPDGRLGLIDYGQVKRIPMSVRVLMSKFIIAVAHEDQISAVKFLRDLGNRSKYSDCEVSWRLSNFWFDRNDAELTMGLNIQEFLDWCQNRDPPVESSDDIVMIGRVSVMMRGLGNAFGIDIRTARLWEPTAKKLLSQQQVNFTPQPSRAFGPGVVLRPEQFA